ncbi:MAG TPA: prepilin-type N-terminal cleavage/methylation domain-containing protein [Dehalococcoidales bacterium]|nr:prepilin-type N-terminal cleavage/methylation domain-containing protein [Dehalococcoidales bacterium]
MKFLVKAITGFFRGQRGIGLMEVLVAVAILGFIGASVVAALSTNYRATRITDEKVTAASLASDYIETIKSSSYNASYPEAESYNITVPIQYKVVSTTECTNDADDAESFSTCTGNETYQRIIVTVYRESGKEVLAICTARTKK